MIEPVKLNSEKYGSIIAFYDKKNDRLSNGYIVRSVKKFKMLSGYMDLNKKLIIDFDEMADNNYFYSNGGRDLCLAYMMENGIDRYFHIRNTGKSYKLVMMTDPESPLIVTPIKDDENHWILSTISEDPKFVLYNYNIGKVVTSYLDHVEIIKDGGINKYYFEKNLKATYEDDDIFVTTLCGFLNKDAQFSSDFLDTDSEGIVHEAVVYRNTLSPKFQELCTSIIKNYVEEYLFKEQLNNEIIDLLYSQQIEIEKLKPSKVYKFPSNKK